MDWDRLRIFHAVASAGSLTHAADNLHLSQSAVSRQISALEESLRMILFHRHARGLILTEQGEHLARATRHMSQELTAATARMRDSAEEVGGDLRVTTTVGFGTLWLTPRLGRFLDLHPAMNVDLILTEALLDLPMREADVAIRLREPNQADVIRRPLIEAHMKLYACRPYLAKHPAPESITDLMQHRLITYSPDAPQPGVDLNWLYDRLEGRLARVLTVNNYYGVLRLAREGLGIAAIPDYMARESDDLVQVLPQLVSPGYTLFFAYPEELRKSRRVAAFRDFVVAQMQQSLAG